MKKKIIYLCSLIAVILLIATLLYAYINSCEKDILIKIYYIGGVVSGHLHLGHFLWLYGQITYKIKQEIYKDLRLRFLIC